MGARLGKARWPVIPGAPPLAHTPALCRFASSVVVTTRQGTQHLLIRPTTAVGLSSVQSCPPQRKEVAAFLFDSLVPLFCTLFVRTCAGSAVSWRGFWGTAKVPMLASVPHTPPQT